MKIDKADISLLLSAIGVAVSLGFGLILTALIAAFLLGVLAGARLRSPHRRQLVGYGTRQPGIPSAGEDKSGANASQN